jgi:tetratricopeptide (TPR) repeat protein
VLAMLVAATGRHDEAIAIASRAREIDPGNPDAGYYAFALGYAGQYEAAAARLEQMIDQSPTNLIYRAWLAYMRIALGDSEAAVRQIETAERLAVDEQAMAFLGQWAYAYSRAGRQDDALRLVAEIEQAVAAGKPVGTGSRAMAYLAIGDEARALEWLEVAAARAGRHEPDQSINVLAALKSNVTNDPVLKQPEFVTALASIRGD